METEGEHQCGNIVKKIQSMPGIEPRTSVYHDTTTTAKQVNKPVELVERCHWIGRLIRIFVASVDDIRRDDHDGAIRQRRTLRGLREGISQDCVDRPGVAEIGLQPLLGQDCQGFFGNLRNTESLN